MHLYTHLFGFTVPSYGLMIVLGIVTANLIAACLLKRWKLDGNDFIILEAYGLLGGFLGAKVLYLIVTRDAIDWNRILEPAYFDQLMNGGFVFYGGLIGGLAAAFLAGSIHKIDTARYLRSLIFLVPLVHCFGRCGCFLAGCCYGVPYDGFGAVVFPEQSYAPSGVKLFPVQLAEAALLLLTSVLIAVLQKKKKLQYTIELYLILYALIRFAMEQVRYDAARGYIGPLSVSQWISIAMLLAAGISIWREKGKKNIQTEA